MSTHNTTYVTYDRMNSEGNVETHTEAFDSGELAIAAIKNIRRRKGVLGETVYILATNPPVVEFEQAAAVEEVAAPVQPQDEDDDVYTPTEEEVVEVDSNDWMLFSEAASFLGVRYQQVFQRAARNALRATRINDSWYASREDVEAWRQVRSEKGYVGYLGL